VNYPARFICTFTAQAPRTSLRSCGANCRKPRATLARPNDAKGGPASTWHGAGLRSGPGASPAPDPYRGEERDATPAHPAARRVYRAFS
jgi:hypothetical protein